MPIAEIPNHEDLISSRNGIQSQLFTPRGINLISRVSPYEQQESIHVEPIEEEEEDDLEEQKEDVEQKRPQTAGHRIERHNRRITSLNLMQGDNVNYDDFYTQFSIMPVVPVSNVVYRGGAVQMRPQETMYYNGDTHQSTTHQTVQYHPTEDNPLSQMSTITEGVKRLWSSDGSEGKISQETEFAVTKPKRK